MLICVVCRDIFLNSFPAIVHKVLITTQHLEMISTTFIKTGKLLYFTLCYFFLSNLCIHFNILFHNTLDPGIRFFRGDFYRCKYIRNRKFESFGVVVSSISPGESNRIEFSSESCDIFSSNTQARLWIT